MALSPLNQRRWRNFTANRRAYWSLWIFLVLYGLSLCAELIANDKPMLVKYDGGYYMPAFRFYSEQAFGGDLRTEAKYSTIEVQCLIVAAGSLDCWDDPEGILAEATENGTALGEPVNAGWMLWPPVRYSYNSIVDTGGVAPGPPSKQNLLGTDDTSRDVLARVIYGFRLSITFALLVTALTSIIGVAAGAVQGYFGGLTDLIFQRVIELWSSVPTLYVIIILTAVWSKSFWLMVALMVLFGWTGLVGVVRAEFLRARNFEYVRAARALGVTDVQIMFRHVLPNAMVATLTFLPFIITGTIGALATLDYLGFGLPASAPSLGQLSRQAQQNLQAPWLGFTAFFTFAIMLSLLVFIFEGVRDAFDPRKTFR
ncbi:MAG: ABC transporter permease [Tabrizicola sp.]|uniref:ABC transporter permease n=1 Tax=Tabrizicola sp. TaxID=2005166 RepID=UPI0027373738|nr:ABC transporter permease [Tabrizicola sp.]MDP3262336.1 ABC transporter permease [Tabrizicola sp.]MDP3647917.1 ABC transporter permease [Paracoccaceae bacterium]MDZ4069929.1 ABC transporter permease [Tabrizicola sp.]